MTDVDNGQDLIDSRDVDERIAELEALEERDEWDDNELGLLRELKSDCGWGAGMMSMSLIRESYFQQHAEEYAEDVEGIGIDSCLYSYVDWESFADNLKGDYQEVTYDGVTYYVR